jgi:branched-chain amino acid transport system substrate-binding protein
MPTTSLPAIEPLGRVEIDDTSLALLNGNGDLASYCEAAIALGKNGASFYWFAEKAWLRVQVRASLWSTAAPFAVSVTLAELPYGVTSAELQVLTLLAAGLTNTEISGFLWISHSTTRTHVEHLLAKLGQRTRTGAAAVAIEEGILSLPWTQVTDQLLPLAVGRVQHRVYQQRSSLPAVSAL